MGFHDYLPYYKNNLKIAGPIMLSQLGGAATQLADNIMVGQLGTVELAAASFSNAVFGIGFLVSSGIAMAATPLIGRHFVCGDDENVSKYLQNSLVVAIATGIAVSAILGIAGTFFPFMGQEAEDPYLLLTTTFGRWWMVVLYIVWFGALWFHLTHGFWSAFQTIGWSNRLWEKRLKVIGYIFATIIFLGFTTVAVNAFIEAM